VRSHNLSTYTIAAFDALLRGRSKSTVIVGLRCGDLREGYFDIDLSYGDVDVSASDLHSLEVVGGQSKAEVLYDEIGPTWRK